jgi:uncharacterized repeat protein (TIGR03803 family)
MIRKPLFLLSAALVSACMLVPFAAAQTFSVLYTFTGGADGGAPRGGVVLDSSGNIYGTTYNGGTTNCSGLGCGTVFKLDATGNETALFDFIGKGSGADPNGNLIPDSQGNLYGMTNVGGQTCREGFGCGTVFKVDRSGHFAVLHAFAGGFDGARPSNSNLVRDPAGNLYGVTFSGGAADDGSVFKIDSAESESVLHAFNGASDGANPIGGLIRDSQGNLYGVTSFGGSSNSGVIFKIDASNNFKVLYQFSGGALGYEPNGGLARDSAGNLYGLAFGGGDLTCQPPSGCGLVYKLDSAGTLTVLHSFHGTDGQAPNGNLIRDAAGNLYGTTYFGGQSNFGTVFKLDPAGNLSVLYQFTGLSDGGYPVAGLTRDGAGNIYGTALGFGGRGCQGQGCGVVFKIAP